MRKEHAASLAAELWACYPMARAPGASDITVWVKHLIDFEYADAYRHAFDFCKRNPSSRMPSFFEIRDAIVTGIQREEKERAARTLKLAEPAPDPGQVAEHKARIRSIVEDLAKG